MARKDDDTRDNAREVVTPKEAGNEAKSLTEATNSSVEAAGEEAANRLKGSNREAFNVTDAVLGADEDHYTNVRKAQAASLGIEYDPKTDEELVATVLVPAPSQNQNNLIHPVEDSYTHAHASKNYLGQPI